MVALALARHPSSVARRIVIVEPDQQLGRGVAYGTVSESHLLNVRASGMSAIADEPAHFLDWANARGRAVTGSEFLPRLEYGPYLRDTLGSAQAAAPVGVTVEHQRALATGIHAEVAGGTLEVVLDDGTAVAAHQVVLATGNRSPRPTLAARSPSRIRGSVAAGRCGCREWRSVRAHRGLGTDRGGRGAVLA